ncbi:MAG TPA: T9SS type A sorting domain-containing protein [Bacteroidales bacterium]|nr:T9SS type A sorting domain-containing protein [Bacteroidales bacterium]
MKTFKLFLLVNTFCFISYNVIPQINAGADQHINCGQCANLQGSFMSTFVNDSMYTVSSIPYAPVCPFDTGISTLMNIDDKWSNTINLPFNFQYYGNTYSQLLIGSNGAVTFDIANANGFCPWSFTESCPSPELPTNSIFFPYQDLDITISGSVYYITLGTAPNRKFVINFFEIAMYSCNNLKTTSQLVLYESSNIIEIYIQNKPLCSSWNEGNGLIGIQNNDGTIGFCAPGRNTSAWSAQNEAWRFYTCSIAYNSIAWLNESGQTISLDSTISVCPDHTSKYILKANCGCYGIFSNYFDTVTVFMDNPNVNLGNDTSLCSGQQIILNAWDEDLSYQWSDNSSDSVLIVNTPGNYSVTVTDTAGCYAIDEITLWDGLPPLQDSIFGSPYVCSGSDGLIYSINEIPGATSYVWYYTGSGTTITFLSPDSISIDFDSNATNGILVVKGTGVCGIGNDSLIIDITVLQSLTGGTVTSSINTAACPGSSALLSLSGYVGSIQWQNSYDNVNWININGATNPIFITPPLTNNIYFRASLTGGCPTAYSNVIQVPLIQAPPTPSICYVSYDSLSQKNKVIWNSATFPSEIDSVKIYNEVSLNQWYMIGVKPAADNGFIDMSSNPLSYSSSYAIMVSNVCNFSSGVSDPHTTITLLSSYDQLSDTYGFTWSPYVGLSVPNYNIYGITSNGSIVLIGSVPGNQYFFNFVNPGTMFIKYFVGFLTPNCLGKTDVIIMSNYVSPNFVSVSEYEKENFSLLPNPASESISILHNINKSVLVKIYDINGQLLISRQITKEAIDVSSLAQGIYVVKIENYNYKLVIQ